jgi:hypothetical protein
MTQDTQPPRPALSLDRVSTLVSDLEQELSRVSIDSSKLRDLRVEIDNLKSALAKTETHPEGLQHPLRSTHNRLDDLVASIEGEALRDTPYLAEMARILGLV